MQPVEYIPPCQCLYIFHQSGHTWRQAIQIGTIWASMLTRWYPADVEQCDMRQEPYRVMGLPYTSRRIYFRGLRYTVKMQTFDILKPDLVLLTLHAFSFPRRCLQSFCNDLMSDMHNGIDTAKWWSTSLLWRHRLDWLGPGIKYKSNSSQLAEWMLGQSVRRQSMLTQINACNFMPLRSYRFKPD
jgi:hypothetical protein